MSHIEAEGELEAVLIRQAQQGDRRAYSELVQAHCSGVIGMIYRMCGDSQLAEDAAQDAFIRAWEHLPKYQPRSSFRNWLYRIAANRTLDILRRERNSMNIDDTVLHAGGLTPEMQTIQAERARAVQAAILRLPAASRSVLVLREFEGFSYKEISGILGIPIGTVMSRLNYARTKLMENLKENMEVA